MTLPGTPELEVSARRGPGELPDSWRFSRFETHDSHVLGYKVIT